MCFPNSNSTGKTRREVSAGARAGRLRLCCIACLGWLFSFGFLHCRDNPGGASPKAPEAIQGTLDLRHWNFERDGDLELNGEWEFYWKRFLEPGAVAVSTMAQQGGPPARGNYLAVPGTWNEFKPEGSGPVGGAGYATYRLKILLPTTAPRLMLRILDQGSAHKTFWNGREMARAGQVGADENSEIAFYKILYAPVESAAGENILLIQISNHFHRKGGLWLPVEIGAEQEILARRDSKRLFEAFLIGAIGIIGLYQFFLFLFRRQERVALYFSLFCLTIMGRVISTGERLLAESFTESQTFLSRVEYLGFYAGIPTSLAFFAALFPNEFVKKHVRILIFLILPMILAVCLLPAKWFTLTLDIVQVLAIVTILYASVALILAARNNRLGARLIILGSVVLFYSICNDIVYNMYNIGLPYIAPVGLLFFIFTQSMALSRRIAIAFNTSEELSTGLEQKVTERTLELAASVEKSNRLLDESRLARGEAENARQEAEILADLSRKANSSRDLNEILLAVAEVTSKRFGGNTCAIYICNESKTMLELRAQLIQARRADIYRLPPGLREVPLVEASGTLFRTYRRRKPFYLRRVDPQWLSENSPVDLAIYNAGPFSWCAQYPLVADKETMAILAISGKNERRLRKPELKFLEQMASQLAGVVRTLELLQQTDEARARAEFARREKAALADISRRLNEMTDISAIAEEVFTFLARHFDVSSMALLIEKKDGALHGVAARSEDPAQRQFWLDFSCPLSDQSGSLYRTYRRQKTLYLPTIPRVDLGDVDRTIVRANNLKAFLQVPLVVQGQTVGIVSMDADRRFYKKEIQSLERFCNQIAGAVLHARLVSEITEAQKAAEQLRQETEKLNQLLKQIASLEDIENIMKAVMEYVSDAFSIHLYSLYTVDRDSGRINFAAANFPDSFTAEDRQKFIETPIELNHRRGTFAHAYKQGRKVTYYPRIVKGFGTEMERWVIEKYGLTSFLICPLYAENELIAFLNFQPGTERTLDREDLDRLSILADLIGGVIHTNNLLKSVKQERELAELARADAEKSRFETEQLNEIARLITLNPGIDEIARMAFTYMETMFNLNYIALYFYDKQSNELYGHKGHSSLAAFKNADFIKNFRIPLDHRIGGFLRAVRRKRVSFFKHLPADGGRRPLQAELIKLLQLKSLVLAPLYIGEELLGVIAASRPGETVELSTNEVASIGRFSQQITGALYTARLLQEAQEARKETEVLANLARNANAAPEIGSILEEVAKVTQERYAADSLALVIVDEKKQQFKITSFFLHGVSGELETLPEELRTIPIQPQSGSIYRTYRRGKIFHLDRIVRESIQSSPVDVAFVRFQDSSWTVQLPLIIDGATIALLIFSGPQPMKLSRTEKRFCERMASQVAGAVRSAELYRQTVLARAESEELLNNVLPPKIAEELKNRGEVEPLFYDAVSVLFTDFAGFTEASQRMLPHELVSQLDSCFSQFDHVVKRNNLEKLKTIGDSYMCAGGLPDIRPTHAVDTCMAALEFREFMRQVSEVRIAIGLDIWQIRIGIHSGPVTAGVIGNYKFSYDIWGDTVNTASRMESASESGKINISGATYELVKDFFECEYRGKIAAKGKGELDMYFLLRIRPELSADPEGFLPNAKFESMSVRLSDPWSMG
ncbi:MAG: GAF domain-containing protein [Spirochaetales bacterium]|nr:GAF domain-containing protein [Spirochaetales bacterium]